MSGKLRAATTALFVAAIPASASAEFIAHKAQWRELPYDARAGFVMGALDGVTIQFTETNATTIEWNATARGRVACVRARQYTANDLAALIDEQYLREEATIPAVFVLTDALNRACNSYINIERTKVGLSPKTY